MKRIKKYTLYILKEVGKEQAKYVGITCLRLALRKAAHRSMANPKYKYYKNSAITRWVASVNYNIEIIPLIINIPNKKLAAILEQEAIRTYLEEGYELVNSEHNPNISKIRPPFTPEHRVKLSKALKNRIQTAEHRATKCIKISQHSKDGTFIRYWTSATDAEREGGFNQSSISNCIKGKLKTTGGFIWRYA